MKHKNIYIEGLALVEGHFSGIGQYTLGVLRGIDETIGRQKLEGKQTSQVTVVIPYDTVEKFKSFGFKNIDYKRVPISFRVMTGLWHRRIMPPLDLFCGKGTYVFTRFADMPLLFSKSIIIIYDISYEVAKQYSDEKNAAFLSKAVKQSIKRASKVITISENAKNEIVDFYKVPSSFVVVATPAVDPLYFYKRSQAEIAEAKRKYGITGDYILTLSNLEPRKNLDGVVDAYTSLPKSTTAKVGLMLVGVNGWKIEKLFDKIIGKVDEGYNIFRPSHYLSDGDKPAIISGAKLLVYPSHYEGFGMPPLEALACGVPVITSNNSSLPEVVGGAGTMVESSDTASLQKAIAHALTNHDALKKQAEESGPKQAQKFSWINSGKRILNCAEELTK